MFERFLLYIKVTQSHTHIYMHSRFWFLVSWWLTHYSFHQTAAPSSFEKWRGAIGFHISPQALKTAERHLCTSLHLYYSTQFSACGLTYLVTEKLVTERPNSASSKARHGAAALSWCRLLRDTRCLWWVWWMWLDGARGGGSLLFSWDFSFSCFELSLDSFLISPSTRPHSLMGP